ncbi:MAG: haloacid dehalogenase-like hydrolase [Oligoflexia bacterium]|nr:haloacid dehalogenase-like hydrolase [Oligoflexia bacterium]
MPKERFLQNSIALIYDFDNTLTPLAMQEYTVLPELGITGDSFWKEVNREADKTKGDRMLTWMRLMLKKIADKEKRLGRKELRALAKNIEYFAGVEEWFSRMNRYVRKHAPGYVRLHHYLISAGLLEIVEGCTIKKEFKRIYASELHYDHNGVATFPSVLINDTMKTQFLFRINKGKEQLDESINEHMPENLRPVPFSHMVYIGDGMSDVPSMTLTKKNGGYAIAVHNPRDKGSISICEKLRAANRVDYFAAADYRKDKALDRYVRNILDVIIADIKHLHDVSAMPGRA